MSRKSFCSSLRLTLLTALVAPGLVAPDLAFAAHKHGKAAPAHKAAVEAPAVHVPTPYVAIDVDSGRVIAERNATRAWYPASVTKLMTVYVALEAVKSGRLTLDTPLVVSARAARMKPSKMGFAPGTQVTLGNALKMLMVKSANDLAVTIAEGVSGSVEAFADEMNASARALGMQESHFVNPNGLHDPNHYSSARDMAVLGRALLLRHPDHADLFNIGAFRLGEQIVPTHNGLIGRYPGADGMKTGFTCPAGFNLVASASRSGRRVIVVVFGDTSARLRTAHAADLLNQAFASSAANGTVADLPSVGGTPPNMQGIACGGRSKAAQLAAESEDFAAPIAAEGEAAVSGAAIAALPRPTYEPVDLFVGPAPGYQGPVAGPRPVDTPIGAIAYSAPLAAAAATAISHHAASAPKPAARGHKAVAPKAAAVKVASAKKDAKAKPSAAKPKHKAAAH
ncbi:D-alanyl-D-alanine carboxypeptidase [Rhodoblastus acidophilus]|uniref:D-alanyl-D-alanine carboxypeptidase n=1 Tax=Rhodoblastus acidophilus TaxID=1074 RepID=A0A212RZS7_RHOAC|nr:D-alanyl-D-alanine carboxypeptidase family protein [Rhodoblastus acidophilus]PPQ36962.1 D-alanyl-D-alanine carboxypeptidase [Rhodoblastus acidophilus]RAI22500.1 D-alanyl-D-alanine carboxypeptidase [Rhodoblastus acidophilus]SNB78358.1 D-alanyl-D-alanine carboxypeptidase [Rhodoblastus acidophilus]